MKYFGIRAHSFSCSGNFGELWEKSEDGYYRCVNDKSKGCWALTEDQIKSDVRNGYLKEFNEQNPSDIQPPH